MSINTAVLFIVFNRPKSTEQVFESIRRAAPERLYIAADGPRQTRSAERALCEEVRRIATAVDWGCEVKTLFRDRNLGCKYAVYYAIQWLFENEERGIILEDDCVPNPDFFQFCGLMLDQFENNPSVGMIAGTNFYTSCTINMPVDYFYSRQFSVWGWASWRRAWSDYDPDIRLWDEEDVRQRLLTSLPKRYLRKYYSTIFDEVRSGVIDTWDFQWAFANMIDGRFCLTPRVNLVSNIGIEGAHGKEQSKSQFLETFPLDMNRAEIRAPSSTGEIYDELISRNKYRPIVVGWTLRRVASATGLLPFAKTIRRLMRAALSILWP